VLDDLGHPLGTGKFLLIKFFRRDVFALEVCPGGGESTKDQMGPSDERLGFDDSGFVVG
jgi:hypothetical protein